MVPTQKQTHTSQEYNGGSRSKHMQPAWFSTKVPKMYTGEMTVSSTNGAGQTEYLHVKE